MITIPQMRFTHVRARSLILPPRRFDRRARALNRTKLAVAKPTMNTDSKSTDIPYRPSKAPGIARCTTLLMIAYGRASGRGVRMLGSRGEGELERCFVIDSDRR